MRKQKYDVEKINGQENQIVTCLDVDMAMNELGFIILKCPGCGSEYDPELQGIIHVSQDH